MQVGEGRQAGTKVWMEYSKKRANKLAVKKENFQTRSGVLWLPEFSFLLEVKGGSLQPTGPKL